MKIEKANSCDHEILTTLTKKSKAYWGYSEEQILQWDTNLTISAAYIEDNCTYKLVKDNTIIGYYSYFIIEEMTIKLDNLFVLPAYIAKGFGKHLLDDFVKRVKDKKFKKIILDSEPNVEKFYIKMGFTKVGQFETSIKNRFMPIMERHL